jgi:hypothetical protein
MRGAIFFVPHVVAASEAEAISIFGKSAAFGAKFQNLARDDNALNDESSNNLLRIASGVPKLSLSRRRVDSCVQFPFLRI